MLITLKADIRAPTAPVIAVVATSSSATSVTLTTAATDVGGVASYTLERSTSSDGTYTVLSSAASFPYADSGLSASTAYYYRCRAVDVSGNVGNYSAIVSATTQSAASTGHDEVARFALEVIAPRAGLTSANRWYAQPIAVPFDEYVSVFGGSFPYTFSFTTAPSGLTVDANTGRVQWTNPTAGTHSIVLQVTDTRGTSVTVSWSMLVSDTNWLFFDAVNGLDANAGTKASPKRTMGGWYGAAKATSTYAGYKCMYRTGTYLSNDCAIKEAGSEGVGSRIPMTSGAKPKVHVAWPGDSVTINVAGGNFIVYSDSAGNVHWSGFRITNIGSTSAYHFLEWEPGGGNDYAVQRCTFALPTSTTTSGVNASFVMCRNNVVCSRISFTHNVIEGTLNHDIFLGYDTNKGVFSDNTISNNRWHGCYLKINNSNWSIRNNTGLTGNIDSAASGTTDADGIATFDGYETTNNVEVCWNNWKSTGRGLSYDRTPAVTITNIYSYRNTWQIKSHQVWNMTVNPLSVRNDVVQYTDALANSHGYRLVNDAAPPSVTGTYTGEECVGRGVTIVDANGLLTGTYRTNYLGLRGHERT